MKKDFLTLKNFDFLHPKKITQIVLARIWDICIFWWKTFFLCVFFFVFPQKNISKLFFFPYSQKFQTKKITMPWLLSGHTSTNDRMFVKHIFRCGLGISWDLLMVVFFSFFKIYKLIWYNFCFRNQRPFNQSLRMSIGAKI